KCSAVTSFARGTPFRSTVARRTFRMRSAWMRLATSARSSRWSTDSAWRLRRLEIPIYEMFNEHGGGQFEFNLTPTTGLGALDAVCLMKIAIKELCAQRGLRATFLRKPNNNPECPVSGYHVHQTLLDEGGRNLFF